MKPSSISIRATWLVLASLSSTFAQQPDRDAPETELASFKLPPGFEINLFASERDGVMKPIQMRWDARGRLWVVGSTTYPQIKPGETPNDKVWILEDTKRGGYADKVTVFADGLMIPTGLEIAPVDQVAAPASGKAPAQENQKPETRNHRPQSAAYIGEGPKLWLMTDTDGDGKADTREVVLRGFGTGDNHQNINSFRWSPGGELMFCQGLHAHARVETPYGIVALDQAGLWRLRPREQRLDAFFGGAADPQNPWGWTFTKWGVPLISSGNSGTMYYPAPEMIRGFQGGRRETIWTTGKGRKTSNPEIIESSHFPDEWQGALVTGGYINNAVWTLQVSPDGAGVKVEDHPTLPPLVQSTHGSFRPVDVKLGPDGALYICDWYNPIIGHYQASFRHPDRDKAHGRIWRVTYKGRPLLTPPAILTASESTDATARIVALAELMRSTDRFPREQAKFTLFGGDTAAVTKGLRTWYQQLDPNAPDADFALAQALGVFEAHEAPEPALLKRVLAAKTPEARAYAAATLARWANRLGFRNVLVPMPSAGFKKADKSADTSEETAPFEVAEKLSDLAHDADPRVRLAAIVAAGNIPRAESMAIVLSSAKLPRDRFIDTALSAATSVLKPQWEPLVASGKSGWPADWLALIKTLDKPKAAPAPAKKVAQQVGSPVVPIYGRLRASPFILGDIASQVREKGNAENGKKVFNRAELACVACHRIGDEGGKVGPALDAIGSAQPLEFIIGTVIEPQREVKEGFETVRITTKKNTEFVGVIVAGNDSELTLRDTANAEHTVAQADIAKREFIGSLMPAGLTDNLSPEDLRDLFAYLSQLGKAK